MTSLHDRVRELRATLMGMIDEETRQLQDEEWDAEVMIADFYMKGAVARHLHRLLGRDDRTIEAEIGAYEAAMEEEIVTELIGRYALDLMRMIPRDVSQVVH